MNRRLRRRAAALALAAVSVAGAPVARADSAAPPPARVFLRLAVGPAFMVESWSPSTPDPGAVSTGWAPALEVTVGKRVRPRWVLAGTLQVAGVIDRSESFEGGSYTLPDTIHFLDTIGALVDRDLGGRYGGHLGAALGLMTVSELDTSFGSFATSWGFAASVHGGIEPVVRGRWRMGVAGRLTLYRYGSDDPPPSATSWGLLSSLLLTFTRQ
ncbi:MAG TPA: hypothetical protein VKZ18_00890 [Polyangia bacterium]|nr:hypothetical protein [Polyangia bacterium]